MKFAYPYFLLALPALGLAGCLLHRLSAKIRRTRLAQFGPASRLPVILRTLDHRAMARKTWLFMAGLCLLAVALARPLWGPKDKSADQVGALPPKNSPSACVYWPAEIAPCKAKAPCRSA